MELAELETVFEQHGHPRFHARQVYRWIWKRGVTDFERMTDLGRALRASLRDTFVIATPDVVQRDRSEDGTQKFVLRLADGRQIESVFIPDTPSQTFCVSTQVGCAMGCAFCLTGKMGLIRHLTAAEIAGQVRLLARATDLLDKSFNIVLMGMGEPLQNYDATMKALRMLNQKEGLDMHPKRVTLSTVGLVPRINQLEGEGIPVTLALSLHAPDDELRNELVPINTRFSVAETVDAAWNYARVTKRRVSIEYAMMRGINDQAHRADLLGDVLNAYGDWGWVHVNLIPLNPVEGSKWTASDPADEREFVRRLEAKGIPTTVRDTRGREIDGACGQLAAKE